MQVKLKPLRSLVDTKKQLVPTSSGIELMSLGSIVFNCACGCTHLMALVTSCWNDRTQPSSRHKQKMQVNRYQKGVVIASICGNSVQSWATQQESREQRLVLLSNQSGNQPTL